MNHKSIKISVITVCYNAAKTIEETIKSVINQSSFFDIEYIIIDGASTDGTVGIINRYKDKISFFVSEADTGIYNAMNKGIKIAKGEYIHFLNANDYYADEDVIDKVISISKKYDADFIIGDVILTLPNKKKIYRSNNNINAYFIFSQWLYHVTLFSKKELFDKFGLFNENYKIAADNDWIMPLMLNDSIKKAYINIPIADFGLDGVSAKEETQNLAIKELEEILCKNFTGKNHFIRKILQDRSFNHNSSFILSFLNAFLRKTSLKNKLVRFLVRNSKFWQIKYCNI